MTAQNLGADGEKALPFKNFDSKEDLKIVEKHFSFNYDFVKNKQQNGMLNQNQMQPEIVLNENSTEICKNSQSSSGNLKKQNPLQSLQNNLQVSNSSQKEYQYENQDIFELELPFEDKVARMPQFHQLFDELQKDLSALVGVDYKNEVKENERSEKIKDQNILPNHTTWLKFVKYYQKNTQNALDEHFQRIQNKYLKKQLQILHRINEQGIHCQKEEELTYNTVNQLIQKEKKSFNLIGQNNLMDKNLGIVNDIYGSNFNNFKNSCMILLTSQKPSSVPESSKIQNISQQNLMNNQSLRFDQNNGNQFQKYNSSQPKSSAKIQQNESTLVASNSFNISQEKIDRDIEHDTIQIKANVRSQIQEKEPSAGFTLNQQAQNLQLIFPQKRYSHSANLIDGKLYVFGGVHRTGSGQSAFHSFYECNLNLESSKEDLFKWKKIQVEAPKNRDSHSCVSFLEQLLIFGGSCNDKSFNDLYKYNITAKMWQKLDPIFDEGHLPSPREGHIAVMIEDDKMLVHGGINEKCEVFDDAFILVGLHQEIDIVQSEIKYDGKSKISNVHQLKQRRGKFEMLRWFKCEQEGNIPSARDSHSASVFNRKVFIFGGQDKDEQLLDDFYIVDLVQGQNTVLLDKNDQTKTQFTDRTFKLIWTEIKKPSIIKMQISQNQNTNWPIKRSSHSMNLFQNRFLVLIGGETNKDNDNTPKQNDLILLSSDPQLHEESSNKKTNKSLSDIWAYDIYLQKWNEIKPPIKVQSQFNNKKMRKSFEPRMAHSATIYGNYIVIFGGYCAQTEQYCQQNLSVLSLLGCTDYMLSSPCTLSMLREHWLGAQISENDIKSQNDQKRILLQNTINSFASSNKINDKSSKMNNQKSLQSNNSTQLDLDSLKKSNPMNQKFNRQNMEIQISNPIQKHTVDQSSQTLQLQKDHQQQIKKQLLYPYKDFVKQTKQIPNCVQLFVNVIKQQIQSFNTFNQDFQQANEISQSIENVSEFQQLNINISLIENPSNKTCPKILKFEDNTQGLMLQNFKNMLEGKVGSLTSCSFKICESALVISRCQKISQKSQIKQEFQIQKLKSQNDFKHLYEVNIGLISQNFMKDSGSKNIIAPIVSFRFIKKSKSNQQKIQQIDGFGSSYEQMDDFYYDLEEITPFTDRFLNLIFDYLRPSILQIFKNVQDIKNYIIKKAFKTIKNEHQNSSTKNLEHQFQTGTEVFFCNLKVDIKNIDQDFIFQQKDTEENNQNQNYDLDLSLLKNLRFGYIDFPPDVLISINEVPMKLENPFREIIQYVVNDEKLAMKGNHQKFRFWITSEQAIIQAYKNNNIDEKETTIEQLIQGFEGIMIFKGNEFIVKDNLCQPGGWDIEGITSQQIFESIKFSQTQDQEYIQFFKNFIDQIEFWDRLHGIIMIDDSLDTQDVIRFDGQGISDIQIIKLIRQEIWKAYLTWKIQQGSFEDPIFTTGLKNRKTKLNLPYIDHEIDSETNNQNQLSKTHKRQKLECQQSEHIENLNHNFQNTEDIQVFQQNLTNYQYMGINQQQIYALQSIEQQHQFQPFQAFNNNLENEGQINQISLKNYQNGMRMLNNGIHFQPIINEPYLTKDQFENLSLEDQQLYIYQMNQPMYMYAEPQLSDDKRSQLEESPEEICSKNERSSNYQNLTLYQVQTKSQEEIYKAKSQHQNLEANQNQENAEVFAENDIIQKN